MELLLLYTEKWSRVVKCVHQKAAYTEPEAKCSQKEHKLVVVVHMRRERESERDVQKNNKQQIFMTRQ